MRLRLGSIGDRNGLAPLSPWRSAWALRPLEPVSVRPADGTKIQIHHQMIRNAQGG